MKPKEERSHANKKIAHENEPLATLYLELAFAKKRKSNSAVPTVIPNQPGPASQPVTQYRRLVTTLNSFAASGGGVALAVKAVIVKL